MAESANVSDVSQELEESPDSSSSNNASSSEAATDSNSSSDTHASADADEHAESSADSGSESDSDSGSTESSPASTDSSSSSASSASSTITSSSAEGTLLDSRNSLDAEKRAPRTYNEMFKGTLLDARAFSDPGTDSPGTSYAGTLLDARATFAEFGLGEDSPGQSFEGTLLDARNQLGTQNVDKYVAKGYQAGDDARRLNSFDASNRTNLTRKVPKRQAPHPPQGSLFSVVLGVVPDFAFLECSGLGFSNRSEDYQEGGRNSGAHRFIGDTDYDNIKLKRGLVLSMGSVLMGLWRDRVAEGRPLRLSGLVILHNDRLFPVAIWRFKNGFPCNWSGPALGRGNTGLAVEELEICHEGLNILMAPLQLAERAFSMDIAGYLANLNLDVG